MAKILIAFFSRKGRTKKIANSILNKIDADIIEITDSVDRKGFLGLLRTMREGVRKASPKIFPENIPVQDYQLVIMGSPVWGGTLCSPMLKFYQDYKSQFNNVCVFVTCLGGLSKEGVNIVKKIVAENDVENKQINSSESTRSLLQLTKRQIKLGESDKKIEEFLEKYANYA